MKKYYEVAVNRPAGPDDGDPDGQKQAVNRPSPEDSDPPPAS